MEEINKFLGGIQQDNHPTNQKENTVYSMLNFSPLDKGGNLYSVTNEQGTAQMEVYFPGGMIVIGSTVLNTDIIVLLVDGEGNCQYGLIQEKILDPIYGYYVPLGPINAAGEVIANNKEFGWSVSHPIDVVSRKLINGHRVIYYTDNYSPIGVLDIDSPYEEGNIVAKASLLYTQKIPEIAVTEIKENTFGTLRPGVVQFVTRYVTDGGGVTSFGIPSNPFPIVPTLKKEGANNYKGGFYDYPAINKSLGLTFRNVDTKFKELEIIVIYYIGDQSGFTASVIGQIPIISDTLTYTYTGANTENEVFISKEELRTVPVTYDRAKCIEQKNNTLFLSNLSSSSDSFDIELQNVANNVKVGYRIEELQFSGRGDDASSSVLGFTAINLEQDENITNLIILFNEDVAVTGAGEFILHREGTPAIGTIDTIIIPLAGDTIIIDGYGTQASVTFTFAATTILSNSILIGASLDETNENIAKAINLSDDAILYNSIIFDNKVYVVWNEVNEDINTQSITSSTGSITTTDFAGASTLNTTLSPTSVLVNEKQVILSFSDITYLTDKLSVRTLLSVNNKSFSTGDGYLLITVEGEENNSTATDIGFTDYTNEFNTVNKKGYLRGEVYSLGFMLLYNNGSTSFVYHIPGDYSFVDESNLIAGENKFPPTGVDEWSSFSQINNSSGRVGTYVSDILYPSSQGYPGTNPLQKKVRHHLMPSLENEPSYRVDSSGITWIRVLDLSYEFTVEVPAELLKNTAEIIFVRERRNTDTNKSIVSQGVVNREAITADAFNNKGYVEGNNITGGVDVNNARDGYYATEIPFFDNLDKVDIEGADLSRSNGGHTRRGVVWSNVYGGINNGTYDDGGKQVTLLLSNTVFFHSPETELLSGLSLKESSLGGAKLVPVLEMKGDYKKVSFAPFKWKGNQGNDFLAGELYADFHGDYNNYDTSLDLLSIPINLGRKVFPGELRTSALNEVEPGIKTGTRWTSGGTELLLDGDLPYNGGEGFTLKIDVIARNYPRPVTIGNNDLYTINSGSIYDQKLGQAIGDNKEIGGLKRTLYNIVLDNRNQYDQVSNASYIITSRKNIIDIYGNMITTYNNIYGGDTFITKFAYTGGQLLHYTGYDRVKDSSINKPKRVDAQRPRGYNHLDGINRLGSTENTQAWGADLRWNTYFFVESNINTHYRHKNPLEAKQNYFPNVTNVSSLLNDYLPYLGNVSEYNTQYSFENNVKEFFTKGSLEVIVSEYENRTIYSEKATSDDTLDSYRTFLQNNYYDLPSNSGPIWDSFILFDTLFLHTPKALWKTFAENSATLVGGNIEEIVLGTGSLFSRPSQQITESLGGYGGSISQFGGVHTSIGYIFPDILQGKVFLLGASDGGAMLKNIGEQGLMSYFHKNLATGILGVSGKDYSLVTTKTAYLIDNPFIGIGVCGGFDFKLNRAFFVKQGDFTLSFSTILNNWFSFHSYSPRVIISLNNRVIFIKQGVWEMNTGNRGEYFGETKDSILEYISNNKNNLTKTYQNLVIYSDSNNGISKVKEDNFSVLQVSNDRNNTGDNILVFGNNFEDEAQQGEVLIKQRNDEYRIAIPRDATINKSNDLFSQDNIYLPHGGIVELDENYFFRERIKGDYAKIKLTYDNSLNYEFVLNYISTIFNNNLR